MMVYHHTYRGENLSKYPSENHQIYWSEHFPINLQTACLMHWQQQLIRDQTVIYIVLHFTTDIAKLSPSSSSSWTELPFYSSTNHPHPNPHQISKNLIDWLHG